MTGPKPRSSYDEVDPAEANTRRRRALSVPCPKCGAPVHRACVSAAGKSNGQTHGARWDAVYAAEREATK